MRIAGEHFIDDYGRTLHLRGLNLAGSSKVPTYPDGATHLTEGFFNHRDVSFVGRPFPLSEARQHYERIRSWGFNFIRFLVTWEAVEHAGPGIYDEEYLDYVSEAIRLAGEYDLGVFVDPHQDVWSRFSGGDGAPGWTFEAAGLDITAFKETGAAVVHQTHGDPLPRMIWPTNSHKLAAATMFTLFFGGNTFAPSIRVDGTPIQDYFQDHFTRAMQQIAVRLDGMPHVAGYGTMNEPFTGYIGWKNLYGTHKLLCVGDVPSPFQSMALGAGIPQEVGTWDLRITGPFRKGSRLVNGSRQSAWLSGCPDIWRSAGVWDVDTSGNPTLLKPDYFSVVDGKPVNFSQEYLLPFALKYAAALRKSHPDSLIFIETHTEEISPSIPEEYAGWFVHEPHWYDNSVLVLKQYYPQVTFDVGTMRLVFGANRIRKVNAAALKSLLNQSQHIAGGTPTLLGEFGIPFDMNGARAYVTGDFSVQENAMDRSYKAVEDNLMNSTLWNYTPDNTNARGDLWNGEDLSIFSEDQRKDPADPYSGGRALKACIRPYPARTAGVPLAMEFLFRQRVFSYTFRPDPSLETPSEIFVPRLHYPDGIEVRVSSGRYEYQPDHQRLLWWVSAGEGRQTIRISPAAHKRN